MTDEDVNNVDDTSENNDIHVKGNLKWQQEVDLDTNVDNVEDEVIENEETTDENIPATPDPVYRR